MYCFVIVTFGFLWEPGTRLSAIARFTLYACFVSPAEGDLEAPMSASAQVFKSFGLE